MRKIFTLCLLLLSFEIFAQLPIKPDTAGNYREKNIIRLRCLPTRSVSMEPLLIIDGVPFEFKGIHDIDPGDIESITILKEDKASALYGCRAMAGVIIITTKSSQIRKIHIKDILNGGSIPAATVCFASRDDTKDSLMFTANDSGIVSTDKLKMGKAYNMTITSVGYSSLSATYTGTNKTTSFALERSTVDCPPVIVSSPGWTRCGRMSCCGWKVISDCDFSVRKNAVTDFSSALLYPNPVLRGGAVTIEINNNQQTIMNISVINLSGQQLSFQKQTVHKGSNRFSVNMDYRWSTGVYFLQLTDEKGIVIKQDRIIIQ